MSGGIEKGPSLWLDVAKQLHGEQGDLGRYSGSDYVVQMVNVLIGRVQVLESAIFSPVEKALISFSFISSSAQAGTEGIWGF